MRKENTPVDDNLPEDACPSVPTSRNQNRLPNDADRPKGPQSISKNKILQHGKLWEPPELKKQVPPHKDAVGPYQPVP